ncbi:MFS transporter [Terrilactibacillus sp. BCM23-1]|uniref:MFS transporter n=1 Tax=Terrilactibacillus tamarindi TaxID=2599694 RepID=A0A6N8CNQ4_9BACI|nr:MFS transporter [Terrilactibacillus tamarindi]MTT31210.1 MFS transporter [Terrilactibacillus tamarindi]
MEKSISKTRKPSFHLFIPVKKSRNFRCLWIGNSLSTLGGSISMIILPILVLQLTHSTVSMGIVMACYMLPNVLILPFAGVIVDKVNRIHLMILMDAFRALISFLVMGLGIAGYLTMHTLYVGAAILGLTSGLFQPAYSALRATVFTPDIRTAANSLSQLSVQAMSLIGPPIGGIIAYKSAPIGFGIDGITYLISLISLLCMTNDKKSHHVSHTSGNRFNWKDLLGGIHTLKQSTWLWVTILAFSFINICTTGIISIIIPCLINVHYHLEPIVYGFVMSGEGIGAAIAAFIFGMRRRWHFRGYMAYIGTGIYGFVLLLMTFVSSPPLLVLLMVAGGMGIMTFGLVWETSLQELVSDESFGRVASLDMLGSFALLPAGYLFTGWFSKAAGGITAMTVLSSAVLVTVFIVLCIPKIRQFD